jgi:hypothetical protein
MGREVPNGGGLKINGGAGKTPGKRSKRKGCKNPYEVKKKRMATKNKDGRKMTHAR